MFTRMTIITFLLFVSGACAPAPTYTADNLIEDLKAEGVDVDYDGIDEYVFFSVPTQLLTINGEANVQLFEFASVAEAKKVAAGVSLDGRQVTRPDPENPGSSVVMYPDWIATPHFFRREALLVLYVGDSLSILRALEAVMGAQFAGGPIPAEGALPTRYKEKWLLPAPPPSRPDQISLPTVWLGVDEGESVFGIKAVLGTTSAFSYQDKISGLNVQGDPAIPSASSTAAANLAFDRSGVIIIAAEYGLIHSIEAWIRPWNEAVENFALFEGERIQGESNQEGDIFTHTLTPLGTTEELLLVVYIQFENPKEKGDAFYIWRLASTVNPPVIPSADSSFRAVYLVRQPGQLSLDDLWAHPEVAVTSSFEEFKQYAQAKIALWIDRNTISQVDTQWLRDAPQKYYPIVLVGDGNDLCAFKETLRVSDIEGPQADCSVPAPGFSVWMLREETGSSVSAFMKGYSQKPTVQEILDVTNPLLKEWTR